MCNQYDNASVEADAKRRQERVANRGPRMALSTGRCRAAGIGLLLGVLAGVAGAGDAPLSETRSTLEKWVETRQMISRERSAGRADKETLLQTVQLLERELKTVEENMGKLSTNSVQVEKERAEAGAMLASSTEALDRAQAFAVPFQQDLTRFVSRLPAPLQDLVKDLVSKLPTAPETKMQVSSRIHVLSSILIELDKFNNAVTIFSEKRKNDRGEEVAVETVYVGLGSAYFVNEAGDFAGIGAPGPNGWEWTAKPELAHAVRDAILIYRQERSARFVALPATIQ